MRTWIGTSGWAYAAWRGSFYPRGLPQAAMLASYAERFAAVEVNASFYALPRAATWTAWSDLVPRRFRFAVKAPAAITHRRRLRGIAGECARLVRALERLGPKRGPVLWQLPPSLAIDLPLLEDALGVWPRRVRLAIEFRHRSWFDDRVFAALAAHRAALCIAETEELATPLVATASWGYLRLRRLDYDARRSAAWARRIRAQPWSEAFAFFRHEDRALGTGFASGLARRLADPSG